MSSRESLRISLARWKTARRVVLGAVILAGSVVTSAAVLYRMADRDCSHAQRVARAYTYSGIGIAIEAPNGDPSSVVVRRVLPDTPAQGKLFSGARLVAVDGVTPTSLQGWIDAIRGAPGSTVNVEVAYPCGGHKTIRIVRDIVRMEFP